MNARRQPLQFNLDELTSQTPAMQRCLKLAREAARSDLPLLLQGETGTGKTLLAHAIHLSSLRSDSTFVSFNASAMTDTLLESQLFGHEKGAFTGANRKVIGKFPAAHEGTLFLDEIGDMPATLQTRLLRVLADGQFYRVGGHTPITVDVRIIAATHQDLEALVTEKRFREDLFHRLNVIRIEAPPLRERREDIPRLLRHFLAKAAEELGEEAKVMTPELADYVSSLNWPGNVRQLQNTAHWLTVMSGGTELEIDDMPAQVRDEPRTSLIDWESGLKQWANRQLNDGHSDLLGIAQPAVERILIRCALNKTQDRRQEAAKLIGWGRNTLTRKIKELELD